MSAYITPIMRSYLDELADALRLAGVRVPPYITQSNGGVIAAAWVSGVELPVDGGANALA